MELRKALKDKHSDLVAMEKNKEDDIKSLEERIEALRNELKCVSEEVFVKENLKLKEDNERLIREKAILDKENLTLKAELESAKRQVSVVGKEQKLKENIKAGEYPPHIMKEITAMEQAYLEREEEQKKEYKEHIATLELTIEALKNRKI